MIRVLLPLPRTATNMRAAFHGAALRAGVGAASLVGLPTVGHGAGQDLPYLTPACDQCRIVFDTVAVLGDAMGPGSIAYDALIAATDSNGRYFVVDPQAQVIQIFVADGTFVNSIGRAGQGPGEFRWPQAVHATSDGRLLVADRGQPRITVFGPDLRVERTIAVTV